MAKTAGAANRQRDDVCNWTEVLKDEAEVISARRKAADLSADQQKLKQDLVGLSFSGGGIRSATFCLGVLQGLAKLDLLPRIDYLSTVSGGGYIGSWFVALVRREPFCGNIRAVQAALNAAEMPSNDKDTKGQNLQQQRVNDSLRYLQANSNYLTQKTGFLSLDTWVLLAIYLRNLLATQLCLLPVFFAVPVTAHLLVEMWKLPQKDSHLVSILWVTLLLIVCGFVHLYRSFISRDSVNSSNRTKSSGEVSYTSEQNSGRLGVVLIAIGLGLTWILSTRLSGGSPEGVGQGNSIVLPFKNGFSIIYLLIFMGVAALIRLSLAIFLGGNSGWKTLVLDRRFKYWCLATLVGCVAGALLYLVGLWMHKLNDPKLLLAIGTPVVLLLVLIVTNLEAIILPKYRHSELIREAWATYGALCLRCAVVWFAVLGVSLFGGEILRKAIGAWSASGITISWLVATGFGLFAGQSSKNGTENSRSWVDFLASLAPYVFLFGLGCILSMMVDYLPGLPKALGVQEPIPPLWSLAGWLGVSLIVALPLSFWLDVNDISLNALYANRLTRAYLGASNPVRWETADGQPFRRSRFLETDDMRLTELVPGEQYSGPLVLVNTALNLAGGDNLAWQERKAASFVVSPLHLGSADLEIAGEPGKGAYYPTTDMSAEARQGMLGRAVSISGAAANPNMGYHSSPAITALMTFFNVRLGWWVPNPVCKTPPTDRPTSVLKWLFKELFGQTNDKARFLNISDGGHFENLGVYELVRRKCRLVIAVDGEADPELAFHGLGTLIRRCRTDLGCDVEIDVDRLRRDPATGHAREHIAIGTIRYDQVDPAHPVGTLVYIKASLTGDEPTDVNQYAQAHADFPHQTTADQFFDESQFESYRSLGLHCVLKAFRPLLQTRNEKPGGPSVEELVYELRRRGFPPPPETHEDFLAAAQPFTEVHKSFRDEKSIAEMARAMYGDLVVKGEPIERLQGIHTSILMMQVLENAWLTLDLETQYSHPLNTGWMNLVHRWSQIPELRRSWPVIRHEFSRGFVEFCETVGGLPQPSRILVENFGNIETLQRHFAEDHDFKVCGLQEALESTQANRDSANVDVLLLEVVPGEESRRIPVGCLLLQSKSDRGSQLHVWVRPRYRGHGHGTYLMDRLQELICEKKIAAPVRVKLPIAPHATHNAVATDKARLLSFFTRYGFRVSRVELKTTELILE